MLKEQTNNVSRLLGQKVEYPTTYDKTILVREERATNRKKVKIEDDKLPFVGFDTWNAYEFTCLQDNGIPVVGILKLRYDCNSKYIVESKSLKLYLNSFNFYKCGEYKSDCYCKAMEIIRDDLSELLETNVVVNISSCIDISDAISYDLVTCTSVTGNYMYGPNIGADWRLLNEMTCSSQLVFPNDEYVEDPSLLKLTPEKATRPQAYWCNTLFSRCKVTKQPDHGDIYIYYNGDKTIDVDALLLYLTSIRNECHFHEEICETVYKRLYELLDHPTDLAVGCLYVRRGGISICPARASNKTLLKQLFAKLMDINVSCVDARSIRD